MANQLVEVTVRALQGRFLLRPSPSVNRMIKGILGRAQRHTGMRVIGCVFLSNHYHLLVEPDSEQQLARFMQFLNTNLSKQLGRLHGWRGPLFERRYQAIPVSDEEEAQMARLRYLLSHGVKEDLVERPGDWPGVHCVRELREGSAQLWGIWHERTRIWEAAQRGRRLEASERVTRETVHLSPLPTWRELAPAERKTRVREMLAEIEESARARRGTEGDSVLGARTIRSQDPHDSPRRSKRSPAPLAHAASLPVWLAMKIAYWTFAKHYREAARLLRAGVEVAFPEGCFPPPAPFVARAGPA